MGPLSLSTIKIKDGGTVSTLIEPYRFCTSFAWF